MSQRLIRLSASVVKVLGAAKGAVEDTAEPMITIGFDDDLPDAEFFVMSIAAQDRGVPLPERTGRRRVRAGGSLHRMEDLARGLAPR